MNKTMADFSGLDRNYRRRIAAVPMAFRRAQAAAIDWDDRLVCIKGPRQSGKTTLAMAVVYSGEAWPIAGGGRFLPFRDTAAAIRESD